MSIALKINGVLQFTAPVEEDHKNKFISWLNETGDKFVGAEVEFLFKPVGLFLKEGFLGALKILNSHSVEIITLGILGTSIGMIIAPLLGSSSGKWFGRIIFIAMVGSVWRLMIP